MRQGDLAHVLVVRAHLEVLERVAHVVDVDAVAPAHAALHQYAHDGPQHLVGHLHVLARLQHAEPLEEVVAALVLLAHKLHVAADGGVARGHVDVRGGAAARRAAHRRLALQQQHLAAALAALVLRLGRHDHRLAAKLGGKLARQAAVDGGVLGPRAHRLRLVRDARPLARAGQVAPGRLLLGRAVVGRVQERYDALLEAARDLAALQLADGALLAVTRARQQARQAGCAAVSLEGRNHGAVLRQLDVALWHLRDALGDGLALGADQRPAGTPSRAVCAAFRAGSRLSQRRHPLPVDHFFTCTTSILYGRDQMAQCTGTTARGERCRLEARPGRKRCHHHARGLANGGATTGAKRKGKGKAKKQAKTKGTVQGTRHRGGDAHEVKLSDVVVPIANKIQSLFDLKVGHYTNRANGLPDVLPTVHNYSAAVSCTAAPIT